MSTNVDILSEIWLEIEDELSGNVGEAPLPVDRRGRVRTAASVDCVGLMAEMDDDGELPDEAAYVPVHLRDFSGNGAAFYTTQEIAVQEHVVLRLGVGDVERAIEAQVVRCVRTSEEGVVRYVVGCRWTQILA